MDRRSFLVAAGTSLAGAIAARSVLAESADSTDLAVDTVLIDAEKVAGPLPHFWEKAAGSDRTVVGLRSQWREDLVRAHRDLGIQSVRCHGLFDDEMGIAAAGAGHCNFLYVDQIYDFMMDQGVRPFVELGFMPEALASSANRIFFYKGNVSPPRKWEDWRDLVQAFTKHCVSRYGIAEVSTWKFEVWNEPNINFWAGSQEEYFELYRQSALAVRSVDKRIQVGGPATAQLGWIPDLIRYCSQHNVPLDFVSSHVYPGDPQSYIFGKDKMYAFEDVIPRGVEEVRHQIEASDMPHLPLWISEWSSQNPAFIAHTVNSCIGLTEAMSYWTFSNVFEEHGVPSRIFNSMFGLIDQWGIARPSFNAFALLHRLGDRQINSRHPSVLATVKPDGSLAILVWNLVRSTTRSGVANGDPTATASEQANLMGGQKSIALRLPGWKGRGSASVTAVNRTTGTALPLWQSMGAPQYPSREQLAQLRAAAELPAPELQALSADGIISITLPPDGIALLEIPS